MPKKRLKEVPIEILVPELERQDSWKGTLLEKDGFEDVVEGLAPQPATQKEAAMAAGEGLKLVEKDTDRASKDSSKSNHESSPGKVDLASKERQPKASPAPPPAQPELATERKEEKRAAQVENIDEKPLPVRAPEVSASSDQVKAAQQEQTETFSAAAAAAVVDFPFSEGSAARKELDEAIKRIETHIKSEQAARRAAEVALEQVLQQQYSSVAGIQRLPATHNTAVYAELRGILADLATAQHTVQRAHAIVARLLADALPTAPESSNLTHIPSNFPGEISTQPSASPIVNHFAASPAVVPPSSLPSSGPSSPDLDRGAAARDQGIAWSAGRPKLSSEKPLPPLKIANKTTPQSPKKFDRIDISASNSPKVSSARSPGARSGRFLTKQGNNAGTAFGGNETPKRNAVKHGPASETQDRFATKKAEAFIISHSARWN